MNGVMRGGRYSREASYIKSDYRNGVNKLSGGVCRCRVSFDLWMCLVYYVGVCGIGILQWVWTAHGWTRILRK